MKQQSVDIILPIYKPKAFIIDTINSIINQTFNNWHLYIIDDASDDGSIGMLKEKFVDYSNKISYYELNINKRAAACRNYAIQKGNGVYISFIDQDDIWLRNKIELQIDYFNQNDCIDSVHGNLQLIDNRGEIILEDQWKKENYKRSICNWQNSSNIELANQLLSHPNIRIISSMIKRRLFEDVGGFKEEYFGGEDMTFWFEVALCGNIGYIDEILFHRRIHDNNTVKKFKGPRLISYLKALDYLKSTYDCVDKSIYRQRYYSKCLTGFKYYLNKKKYILSVRYFMKLLFFFPDYLINNFFNVIFGNKQS
jgi:glycosyltransferase involved in cell wall biosynthesis